MGIFAWISDALISWQYYLDATYLEMLYIYDENRKLLFRSLVVLLFFVFGLVIGYMMDWMDRQRKRDAEHIRLLDGVHDLERLIGNTQDPVQLLEKTKDLLKDIFQFEEVYLIHSDPQHRVRVSYHTTDPETLNNDDLFRKLMKSLESASPEKSSFSLPPHHLDSHFEPGHYIVAPLVYNRVLHGGFLGTWKDDWRTLNGELWEEQFQISCRIIGQASSHLEEIEEAKRTSLRVKKLHDLSPMGVFVTTRYGNLQYLNPSMMVLLFGTDQPSVEQKNTRFQQWFLEPERYEELLGRLLEEEEVSNFDCTFRRSDGTELHVLMAARLNPEDNPEDPHIEGYVLDVTSRIEMESSNRELQAELEKSRHFQAISVLAGGVAHEFNNILQIMMGCANLAQLKVGTTDSELTGYLNEIQGSGQRAATLCDQMLSYAGKRDVKRMLVEADTRLEHILSLLQPTMDPDIDYHLHLGAPGVKVHLDTTSLSEVVRNLFENAMDALELSDHGLLRVSTRVMGLDELQDAEYIFPRALYQETYWVMSFQDNGEGIAEDILPRIFEPFYSTKFQGRGLGLCAAIGVLEKQDGTMGVKSQPGEGTEFVMCLPVAESVEVLSDPVAKEIPKEELASPEGKRIWIVDDEPMIGEAVMRMLEGKGYVVQVESDPATFMRKFTYGEMERTHCVILDVVMPQISGLEILKWIRDRSESLPVLIISGLDDTEHNEHFEKLEASGFIRKPFQAEELSLALQKVLRPLDPDSEKSGNRSREER